MQAIISKTYDDFPEELLKAARSKYGLRRVDRFISMAVAAVKDAVNVELKQETALVTVSAFGPHKTVFATLDDILDFPEDQILPTKFSHSVHNAAASYIGTVLGIKGPAFAITGFEDALQEGISLAETLVSSGMAPNALLVEIEENGMLTNAAPQLYREKFNDQIKEIVNVILY